MEKEIVCKFCKEGKLLNKEGVCFYCERRFEGGMKPKGIEIRNVQIANFRGTEVKNI